MLFWFIFCVVCLCVGIVSLIIDFSLMDDISDRWFDLLGAIGILGILIGVIGSIIIVLEGFWQRSLNNKIVDGIVENPSGYEIYFDDGTYTTLGKNNDITIVKDTDTMKVDTIKMFTYSFEIPGDCIIWQWQPYSKMYGGASN